MKRLIVLLAVVMVAMTIYAGVFGNTRNVSGIVFFLDGHKETFQSITIPYAGDKDFKGIDESGNKRTVKALDVEHLELWHPKYPEESRDVLWSCFDTKANGTKKFVSWSFVTGKGKYISHDKGRTGNGWKEHLARNDMYQACGVGYIPILRLVAQCDG